MASYKIETNKKGLVAKINIYTKDIDSGKNKIITKRVYNEKNLTEAKFEKYVEKYSMDLEEEYRQAYIDKRDKYKNHVLTFKELADEFVTNIKINLSDCYYQRARDVVSRFQAFLEERQLHKEPISSINVRDVQIFLNSFQTYKVISHGYYKLKKDFPKTINLRELARQNIIDRCSSYELRRNKKSITVEKAKQICDFCKIDFDEYFYQVSGVKTYSTETIKGYRRVLRTIFNEAVRYDWIAKNPVCQTKIGAGNGNTTLRPIHEKEVFSLSETKDFIKELDKLDNDLINKKMILKFMILTGVRIAEMCALRWSDIDFEKKIVHITKARMQSKEKGIYEKEPKTKTSIRDIPLNDTLLNDLREFQRWFRLADNEFDDNLDKYYIAVNMYREPVSKDSVGVWLRQFENKHGFKHVSCHGLRHTYCSLLLSQNVPIQTVSKYMGHSDSTITLKVYSHFIPDTQEKVVNALNNIV